MTERQQQSSSLDEPPGEFGRQTFNIDDLLREKNPALHRRLPRPAIKLLGRLLHCDQINCKLHELRSVPCRQFPEAALKELGVDFRIEGAAPDPSIARPVFVANHPTGGLDGLVMLSWLLNHYDQVKVPANDILAKFPHLRPLVAPINKFARQRDMASILHATFGSSAAILVFPAGRTSRPEIAGGRLSDFPWQKMAVRMARAHQRPLIPVFISGRNSKLFYAIHHLRRWLAIRTNLEIFLLVREMLQPTCRRIVLHFGKAVWPTELENLGADDSERMQHLREACYRLDSSFPPILTPSLRTKARVSQ